MRERRRTWGNCDPPRLLFLCSRQDRLQGLLAMALNDWRAWPRNSGRRSACATSSIGFPTRRAPRSKTGKPAWHLLPDLKNPHRRPTCHPDSCGCVSWSATIDDWLRIAAKGRPACAICIRKRKARPPSAPCSAQVLPNWQSLLRGARRPDKLRMRLSGLRLPAGHRNFGRRTL